MRLTVWKLALGVVLAGGVSVSTAAAEEGATRVLRAAGLKCERCWNYRDSVGKNKEHPALCHRCTDVLKGV